MKIDYTSANSMSIISACGLIIFSRNVVYSFIYAASTSSVLPASLDDQQLVVQYCDRFSV